MIEIENRRQYLPQLDGVRALCATLVVAGHSGITHFSGGGMVGVGIFFTLSGFLITRLFLDEYALSGRIDYFAFQKRRLIRLYPALVLFLLVFTISMPFIAPKTNFLKEVPLTALYLSNFGRMALKAPDFLGHSWTLATEMQFYILWPVVLAGMLSCFPKRLPIALLTLFASLMIWRFAIKYVGNVSFSRSYFGFDAMAASLVLGGWLAAQKITTSPMVAAISGFVAIAIAALICLVPTTAMRLYNVPAIAATDCCAGLLLVAALQEKSIVAKWLKFPILVRLGIWSYGIYLWHYPIVRFLRMNYSPLVVFAIAFTLSVAFAALSYHYFETPLRRWLTQRWLTARVEPEFARAP
jgi:peptidoglycan/LPS O-acetylase OafA/YrhL